MTISLDQIKMRVLQTSESAVVNMQTIFNFTQKGNEVTGVYSGGRVQRGYLVGRMGENRMSFAYCQLHTDGTMDNGSSKCEISENEEGKLQLVEHFQWSSRPGAGMNVLEEM